MDEQVQTKAEDVTSDNFKEKVLDSDKPVLIDFWASWCMPCLMMAPILDELANEMSDKLNFVKLNTEIPEHRDLAFEYDIRSIPNMKLMKAGKVVKEFIGARPKEVFKEELEEALAELE